MSLPNFGSLGAYQSDLSSNASLANALAQQNTNSLYNYNVSTSTSLDSMTGLVYGGFGQGIGRLGTGSVTITNIGPSAFSDLVAKTMKPAKKAARGALMKLREEIDGWHGDVLERCIA